MYQVEDYVMDRIKKDISEKGYSEIPRIFSKEIRMSLLKASDSISKYYSEDNLKSKAVYLSDKAKNRESHSIMVSLSRTDLPNVYLRDAEYYYFVSFWNDVLYNLHGTRPPNNSRSMLNFQRYQANSSKVGPHHDGEYIRYTNKESGYFQLHEGLLPRYVGVYILENDNFSSPSLMIGKKDELIKPECAPGSMIIFDNLMYHHEVIECLANRRILGIRNFDFQPIFFTDSKEDWIKTIEFKEYKSQAISGWVHEANSDFTSELLQMSINRWNTSYKDMKEKGAVF